MAEPALRRVESLQVRRDAAAVKQQFDYSSGSAALATLLSFGLDDRVSEQDFLRALLLPSAAQDLAKLEHQGLTLAALQKLARARGHRAQGFRIESSQLGALTRPVIVFIRPNGFPHCAVLKGLRGDRVYLADCRHPFPARHRTRPRQPAAAPCALKSGCQSAPSQGLDRASDKPGRAAQLRLATQ
jgi:predicted double-glycine peptidase